MKIATIVIAIINEDLDQLRNCITSIDRNRFEVIIVYPTKYHADINAVFAEMVDSKIKTTAQTSIRDLWQQGEKPATTPWIVFIQSSDILTVQLQKDIDQGCRNFTPYNNYKYNLQRISIFLKRRLKYCHFWTGEPISHIKFKHSARSEDNNKNQPLEEAWPTPMGNLVHYGPETLSNAITTAVFFIEEWAESVFQKSPNLDKKTIFIKAIKESLTNLSKGLFLKKWIRDGYEGCVFALFDFLITCFGYLRYYEEYIRSGRQLRSQIDSIQNLLLIQVNGIGDTFNSTPTLRNIKERLPNANIDVLVNSSATGMLKNNPYINNFYTSSRLPNKAGIKRIAKNLKSFSYDLIINLTSRNSTEKLTGLLNSKWKVNINYFHRERFTDVMVGFKSDGASFIRSEFDFLKKIGFKPKKYYPEIFLKSEDIDEALHFIHNKGLDTKEKLVVLHPFSSDPIREWKIECFIDLAKRLEENHKCNILIVGQKNEIEKIKTRTISSIPRCIFYDGPVRNTVSIISQSNLLIGGDSAFSHISSAINIPTLVIQGPIWKPYLGVHWDTDFLGDKENTFLFCKEDLSCRDILNSACGSCSDQICFDFSVDEVLEQTLKMLN